MYLSKIGPTFKGKNLLSGGINSLSFKRSPANEKYVNIFFVKVFSLECVIIPLKSFLYATCGSQEWGIQGFAVMLCPYVHTYICHIRNKSQNLSTFYASKLKFGIMSPPAEGRSEAYIVFHHDVMSVHEYVTFITRIIIWIPFMLGSWNFVLYLPRVAPRSCPGVGLGINV